MNSTTEITKQEKSSTSSCVAYECHSILICREIMDSLKLDNINDDEDSEYDHNSEASDCDSECDFEEDLELNYGINCSSPTFQDLVTRREVNAIIGGINLLSYDFESDEEDSDSESEEPLTTEEGLDTNTDVCRSYLISNDTNTEDNCNSELDCSEDTCKTIHRVCSIEDFERQTIEKKISMGKIKECNIDGSSGSARFQFVNRHSVQQCAR